MSGMMMPLATAAIQALMGRAAPYDAAKAQTYAIEQLLDKMGPYSMVQNAISPPLDRPFQVMENGKPTWKPAVNTLGNITDFKASGHPAEAQAQFLKKLLAGANTQMPASQKSKGNFLSDLLSGIGL